MLHSFTQPQHIELPDRERSMTALGAANAVEQRAGLDFRYYSTGSPFEYETIRFLYVHKREIEDQGLRAKKAQPKRRDASE